MENPWINLRMVNNEFIAECDKNHMYDFRYRLRGDYRLRLEGYPGPYTGDPFNSVLYILALNPGHCEGEEIIYRQHEELFLNNLTHTNVQWPFITFFPELRNTPGGIWWTEKLKQIIFDTSLETVSKYIFNAEYFPYHSKKYKNINKILPSQRYTFFLVKNAIQNNKYILIMRSEETWYNVVPELRNYSKKVVLNNIRRPWITSGNMDPIIYQNIINTLRRENNGT